MGSPGEYASQMPSAGLSEVLADGSFKAHIPARIQWLTYQLFQNQATYQSLSQPCSCCWPVTSRGTSDLTAPLTAIGFLLDYELES